MAVERITNMHGISHPIEAPAVVGTGQGAVILEAALAEGDLAVRA
jgi:hypothetical protein